MMNGQKISRIFAFTVATLMVAIGIMVLAGSFLPPAAPPALRYTLGIVFVLMGIYRFSMARLQAKQMERSNE